MRMAPKNVMTSGIILAGTFPWENSAFDRLSTRPLAPVGLRPLMAFSLSWMQNAGLRSVVVCGNRNSRALEAQLAQNYASELELSYLEDTMPRGAAGCVRDAALSSNSQTFVVTDGAAIPMVDLNELLEAHRRSGAAATIVVYDEPSGSVHPALVPAGVYVFERRILEPISPIGFTDIKEHLVPNLVRAGERVVTYTSRGSVPRVLNADTYLAVNEYVTNDLVASRVPPEGYRLVGSALIHRDSVVASDVTMAGPIMIGPGVTIHSKAVIIGPTTIGCDVTIEGGALVSRSAIWRRAHIHSNAAIDRSIVADDAVIERDRSVYRAVVAGKPSDSAPQAKVQRLVAAPRSAA